MKFQISRSLLLAASTFASLAVLVIAATATADDDSEVDESHEPADEPEPETLCTVAPSILVTACTEDDFLKDSVVVGLALIEEVNQISSPVGHTAPPVSSAPSSRHSFLLGIDAAQMGGTTPTGGAGRGATA